MDISLVESKLSDVTVTPISMTTIKSMQQLNQTVSQMQHQTTLQQYQQQQQQQHQQQQQQQQQQLSGTSISPSILSVTTTATAQHQPSSNNNMSTPMTSTNNIPSTIGNNSGLSKYAQLLAVIEEMGRDIRPTYTGSRSSAERLKRGIIHSRILVRECLLEVERSARQ